MPWHVWAANFPPENSHDKTTKEERSALEGELFKYKSK